MKPEEYEKIIKWDGEITCLHSELFLKGSHGECDPLIIFTDGIWHVFAKKEKITESLKNGLELFSNKNSYESYSKEFRKYIKDFKNIDTHIRNKKDFKRILHQLAKLWQLYGKTEHFYTELAFKKSNDNRIIQNNLSDLEILKVQGREILNKAVFDGGILHKFLNNIPSKRNKDNLYLYANELEATFRNVFISEKIIDQRKGCYAITKKNNKIQRFSYEESLKLAEEFLDKEFKKELKGTVAYSGKVKGHARIIPMLTKTEEINKYLAKMQEGDILLAQSTSPDILSIISKASAIVTDQGGLLSHAATIARERKIPCIVGTTYATEAFNDGDLIEVDAIKGIVKKIE